MNKTEITRIIEDYHKLIEHTYPIFSEYLRITGVYSGKSLLDWTIRFESDFVYGTTRDYDEEYEFDMPIEFVWSKNVSEDLEELAKEEERKKQEKENTILENKKKAEYQTYLNLKAKFEPESPLYEV